MDSVLPPVHRRAAVLLVAALVAASAAACDPSPVTPSATPGGSAAASVGAGAPAEPNVISGRVTTEAGAPVAGASVRVVGYTGGASLGREIETLVTGADGTYRFEAPRGLYEVLAEGPLAFDGQTYLFDLDPLDGGCEQQPSDSGIVKDFALRLTGLAMCFDLVDPENYYSYHGAVVQLHGDLPTAAPDDVVEYRFEPVGALADGRAGTPVTYRRTVAALSTSAGPLDRTWVLHDIPLARYRVSAVLVAGGARVPLLVATDGAPGASADLAFPARSVLGEPEVGYQIPDLSVSEGR